MSTSLSIVLQKIGLRYTRLDHYIDIPTGEQEQWSVGLKTVKIGLGGLLTRNVGLLVRSVGLSIFQDYRMQEYRNDPLKGFFERKTLVHEMLLLISLLIVILSHEHEMLLLISLLMVIVSHEHEMLLLISLLIVIVSHESSTQILSEHDK